MTAADSLSPMEHLQDLFYRSQFSRLLRELGPGELDAERSLLRANTLFEMHRVDEARQVLESLMASDQSGSDAVLYAQARLAYLDNRPEDARPIFEEIRDGSTSPNYRFKSLLGIANTWYTERAYDRIPALLETLHAFEPLPRADERISFLLFLGNFYIASGTSTELAKQYYRKALSAASAPTWTYFITRSLYGLARVCDKLSQTAELMWTLDLLQSFVDQSEQHYFSYVVNEQFKNHFAIATPMEFDTANHRIFLKDKWIAFHDRPLLFQFLFLLHEKGTFVEKDSIAHDLWPHEPYKPRVHDPRIFDIAKRARQLIEAYENQPVVLLSGRLGYKLASS